MAGYSGTPLVKKLGIKPGCRLHLINAPPAFDTTLGELPEGVRPAQKGAADVILLFITSRAALERAFPGTARRLDDAGGLWVCWPKKASKVPTDVDENIIREIGLLAGLVDNKVCAVDDTWSGLRFVVRVADRGSQRRGSSR